MLAEELQKPLYEMRPDIFPHGRLTPVEIKLWEYHYRDRAKEHGKHQ